MATTKSIVHLSTNTFVDIMSATNPPAPTDRELEILNILWQNGPSSVKDVHTVLERRNSLGYTTTLKFLQIMLEKGLVSRDTSEKVHVYTPLIKQKETQSNLLGKLVDTVFNGSTGQLVLQALGNKKATGEELDAIRQYLKELEKTAGKKPAAKR